MVIMNYPSTKYKFKLTKTTQILLPRSNNCCRGFNVITLM